MSKSRPHLVPPRPRPRDLLQLTAFPIHPFDQAHGVDTSGLVPAAHLLTGHPNDEHVTAYYGVAPSILRQLIAQWRETIPPYPISSYTFLDIGSGKGRALLVASEYPFKKILGIELNPALATIARQNVAAWTAAHTADATAPPVAPIEVLEQDALDFAFPTTPTLLFLFHPFEAPVLTQLLTHIETQLSTKRPGAPPQAQLHATEVGSKKSTRPPGAPSQTASPSEVGSKKSTRPLPTPSLDILYVNAECAPILDKHPAFTRLFFGNIPMTPEDHAADLEAIARQKEYGSTGDEECAIYRFTGSH